MSVNEEGQEFYSRSTEKEDRNARLWEASAPLIKRPSHYVMPNGIECKDVIKYMPGLEATAMRYLWRAGRKEASTKLIDLKKCRESLDMAIEFEESKQKENDNV